MQSQMRHVSIPIPRKSLAVTCHCTLCMCMLAHMHPCRELHEVGIRVSRLVKCNILVLPESQVGNFLYQVHTQGPTTLPLVEALLELLFHDPFQHHLQFGITLCDVQSLNVLNWIFMFGNRKILTKKLPTFSCPNFAGLCAWRPDFVSR